MVDLDADPLRAGNGVTGPRPISAGGPIEMVPTAGCEITAGGSSSGRSNERSPSW